MPQFPDGMAALTSLPAHNRPEASRGSRPGLLVTADGEAFSGVSIGAEGIATGEAVFNTSMTGYEEVLTDPSYAGQVVVMTASHIGNYGSNEEDAQADRPFCSGLVVRALTERPSSWRAAGSFRSVLRRHGTVALAEVDTRRLTRHLRSRGAMPVALGTGDRRELADAAAATPLMRGRALALGVATAVPYRVPAHGEERGKVVLVDLGVKRAILQRLADLGLGLTVVPPATPAAEILALSPAGVILSNGPGDPEPLAEVVTTTRALLGKVPVLGICLGHQLMALAVGARTFKLPFGHHGGNHPVRSLADGRVAITAHNHGFAVDLWPLARNAPPPARGLPSPALLPRRVETDAGMVVPSYQNLNDGSLEGLDWLDVPAASVQFHPEAAPGPHDALGILSRFVERIVSR